MKRTVTIEVDGAEWVPDEGLPYLVAEGATIRTGADITAQAVVQSSEP